jgi:hypothetical protein
MSENKQITMLLYTCPNGLELIRIGKDIRAWSESSISYEEETSNILIEVPIGNVCPCEHHYGEWEVKNVESVKIIDLRWSNE